MRTVTATHASRGFSDLLDAVEHGETVAITRGGHVVAEIRPAVPATGRSLREALAAVPPLDDTFGDDVVGAIAMLVPEQGDPWRVD